MLELARFVYSCFAIERSPIKFNDSFSLLIQRKIAQIFNHVMHFSGVAQEEWRCKGNFKPSLFSPIADDGMCWAGCQAQSRAILLYLMKTELKKIHRWKRTGERGKDENPK